MLCWTLDVVLDARLLRWRLGIPHDWSAPAPPSPGPGTVPWEIVDRNLAVLIVWGGECDRSFVIGSRRWILSDQVHQREPPTYELPDARPVIFALALPSTMYLCNAFCRRGWLRLEESSPSPLTFWVFKVPEVV